MGEKKSYETQVFGSDSQEVQNPDLVDTPFLHEESHVVDSELVETAVLQTQVMPKPTPAVLPVESHHETVGVGYSWVLQNADSNKPKAEELKQASPRGKGSARVTIPFTQYGTVDESRAGIVPALDSETLAGDAVHQASMETMLEEQRKSYNKIQEVLGTSERGRDSIDPTRPDLWPEAKRKLFPQIVEGLVRAGMEYKLDEDNMSGADLTYYKEVIESIRTQAHNDMSRDTRRLDVA